jgi:hypothetical protein
VCVFVCAIRPNKFSSHLKILWRSGGHTEFALLSFSTIDSNICQQSELVENESNANSVWPPERHKIFKWDENLLGRMAHTNTHTQAP